MFKRSLILSAAAAAALTLSSPGMAKTVTDVEGRTVEIPDNPERVLLGFYFEDFFAIVGPDAYDRVVAISRGAWEEWRNLQWQAYVEAVPRIDELLDVGEVESGTFNIEAAVAAEPDVAILAAWQIDGLGEAVAKLEAAGIPVVVADYNAQTVEKHVASTLLIGDVMGTEERAKTLATEYEAAVADVEKRVAEAGGDPKKVYVELGNKGPDEIGNSYGEGMWAGVVDMAGGDNIAAGKIGNWGPLNPEYVLASNPEAIFIAGSDWASREKAVVMGPGIEETMTHERLLPFIERAGWAEIDAVKSGEVHAIYHGGARTLYDYAFLQYIAKTLHPDAFADVDPDATLKQFFDTYMPVAFKGTYMTRLK
ncbi:MAG: ABC transporter substrate-binding protein [Geminicoccaceae bacterium]